MTSKTASEDTHQRLAEALAAGESELIRLHRDLVRIPTVNRGDGSSARESEAAAFAAECLKGSGNGILSRIVESAPGRGNLLAELKSDADGPTLILVSHSDVVPAGDESAWSHPPFSGEVADGRVWGRGSNDCKMLVAAEIFVMRVLAETGLMPCGTLRLAMGADEEAGGRMGFGWLAENEAEFLRADLGINEGGGAAIRSAAGDRTFFTVGCGEKGRYEVRFTMKAPGGHASIPWGRVNPLAGLAALAGSIIAAEMTPRADSPIFGCLARTGALSGAGAGGDADMLIESASRAFSPAFGRSLMAQSRMTVVPTMIRAGEKSNAIPDRAELICDARIMPGQTREELERRIAEIAASAPGVAWNIEETAAPSVSEFTPDREALFTRALECTFAGRASDVGRFGVMPTWCTGFTDSRFLRGVGTPMFGFQIVDPLADPDRLSIHCVDESIDVRMLLTCARALGHLILDFCAGAD